MIDILPKKASPILNKKTNPKIPIAIENPFFLKKLITGPPIVPDNHDKIFVKKLLFTSLFLMHRLLYLVWMRL